MAAGELPNSGTADGAPLSFDKGVEAIADLLGPDIPAPVASKAPEDDDDDAEIEAQGEDTPDAEVDDAESPDAEQDGEEDGSDDYSGGKFAADDAKVKLKDGRTITVSELKDFSEKRAAEFQRDYTRKSQEVAESRNAIDSARQTLAEQRDILVAIMQQNLPQQPDPSMLDTDPIGYFRAKEDYDRKAAEFNQLHAMRAQELQRQQQDLEQRRQQLRASETERMIQWMPELKDPAKRQAFAQEAVSYGEQFGITAEDIGQIEDARMLAVLRDAIAYRKLKASTPKVQKAMEGKPRILPGTKRADPKAGARREAEVRKEALRKTGTLEAGVAALMDLDL